MRFPAALPTASRSRQKSPHACAVLPCWLPKERTMMADGAAGGETVIAIRSGLPMQQPRPPRRIAAAERAGISAELESGALLQRSYVGRQRFGLQRRQRRRRRQGDHIGGPLARQAQRPDVEAGCEIGEGGIVITPIAAPQIDDQHVLWCLL